MPVRIVVLGYQLIGHTALSFLLDEAEDEVVGLWTHADAPGEEVWWPSAAELARSRGVPVFSPEDVNAPESVELLEALAPDILLCAWYRQLLKSPALGTARRAALNLHGSLLPRYRGRAPVNWVLVNGETETGMTLHHMVPRADAGDIVAQAKVAISPEDTALTVYHKLAAATVEVLCGTWPALRQGRAPRVAQDESLATYVGRRTPQDGRFEWSWPAGRIHNLVRAVTHPYPGAFVDTQAGRLYIWESRPLADSGVGAAVEPGTVIAPAAEGFVVATGEDGLLVKRAQYAAGPELGGPAFWEQYGLAAGRRLI